MYGFEKKIKVKAKVKAIGAPLNSLWVVTALDNWKSVGEIDDK